MDLATRHLELIDYIQQGKFAEGIDEFYAPNVVARENANPPAHGRDNLASAERAYLGGVTAFHGVEVLGTCLADEGAGTGTVMYECEMNWDHEDTGRVHVKQAVVERWRDGFIEDIRFYGTFVP